MIIADCKHCEHYVTDACGDKVCAFDGDCENYVQNNEEWFCGLSTEEKAKFLRKIYRDGRDDYVGEWYEQTEADFVEWLKQPHTNS